MCIRDRYQRRVHGGAELKQIKSEYKFFPMREFQFYEKGNLDGMQKKLVEYNEELKNNGESTQMVLTENNILYMKNLCENLKKPESSYKDIIGHSELSAISKLLTWPHDKILPVFDLIRLFSLHFQAEKMFKGSTKNIFIDLSGILQANNSDVFKALCLKLLCNQFKNIGNQTALISNWELIMDGINAVVAMEGKGPNLSESLAFLIVNFSLIVREKIREKGKVEQVCQCCKNQIGKELLAKNVLKILIAIGNMVLVEEIRNQVKQSLSSVIQNLNISAIQGEQEEIDNMKECLQDLNEIL
eukprot:TRINITY_DN2208_c0_g1_i4.p1 TRINITY_DN2208_c0_g1~~TRINITY_DN2208_c0_g1_i4.p1  ORF type:complete len:301 (-),score=54.82 TRINITY_DN2208_c0_g1_i4:99-1001(-)